MAHGGLPRDERFLALARYIRRRDWAEAEIELDLLARDSEGHDRDYSDAIRKGRLLAARDMVDALAKSEKEAA